VGNQSPRKIGWSLYLPPIICFGLLLAIYFSGRNVDVFLWLNHQGRFGGDNFWIAITTLGDGLLLLVLVLPFIRRRPDIAWSLIVSFLLVALFVKGIKIPVVSYRPVSIIVPDRFRLIGAAYRYNSFPSGHAASAAAFFGTICIFYRQRCVRTAAIALAVLIACSRVAMGLHWPTDVLVGFLGGWISALFAYWISRRLTFGKSRAAQIIFAVIIGGAAIRMLLINHTDYPQAFRLLQIVALSSLIFAFCDYGLARRKSRSAGPDENPPNSLPKVSTEVSAAPVPNK
jgi:membrane-associated phospholipid phosphatase